ncbi:MAG: thermonuclease family protein [Bdellovibrionales bacterium]|nr:thermonuclease family protein [Bdellovibrionales bacterium]
MPNRNAEAQAKAPIQTSPFDLTLIEVGTVVEIVKPDTVRLQNGKVFKLDNIRIPLQLDGQAIEYLNHNVLNKKIGFYIVGEDPTARANRFGHTLSHAITENGDWVQAQMIARGLAWVFGAAGSRDLYLPLLKHEELARSQSMGLWGLSAFAVKDNKTIMQNSYNSFQVYEGEVVSFAAKEHYTFINFGKNPKTDFTILVNQRKIPRFRTADGYAGHAPESLIGKKIRVRGWVEENSGPMIELLFPEQLELPPDAQITILNE